jgi:hypothetical protein
MGTLVRLYLGWQLFRVLRPLLGAAVVIGMLVALSSPHGHRDGRATSVIGHAAAGGGRDLPRAIERAFRPGPSGE